MVTSFKYLVWVISAADDYCTMVVRNLSQAQLLWQSIIKIISREGAAPQVSRFFFKAVVQLVMLFGAETWVVTPTWAGYWGGFRTMWRDNLRGGSCGGI